MQQRFGDTRVRVFLMFLFLAVFAFPSLSFAQAGCRNGVLSLGDGTEAIRDLNGCLAYLEDPEQSLTFDQVLALPPGQFNRHDEGVLNFGYTESAYWLKMEINTRDLSGPVD
ncbi:MAG: 7TM-DISM domain-containing protein, partial [Marinobacter sp.]|uniref:7TMR-DISMED2 domain-containing protein n=1 Tax=Marinobacter sp. TaxID=50741 RepID=UPI0032968D37